MKNIYSQKAGAFVFFCSLFLFSFNGLAQVGIGNTDPHESSLLDISDGKGDKGILIPRVNIADLTTKAPITTTTIEESLLVYNTNTTTGKGFYYWNGSKWVGIDGGNDWELTGNSGTSPGTNFIGTLDNVHFEAYTNNASRMRIQNNGQITMGLGAGMANANQQVNVKSTFTNGIALGGYSEGTGSGLYGENIGGGYGVHGSSQGGVGVYGVTIGGIAGVTGENLSGNGWSVQGIGAPIFSDNTMSNNHAFMGRVNHKNSRAFWGVNETIDGLGIVGGYNNLSVIPEKGGVGVAGSGPNLGIMAYAGAGTIRGNAAGLFVLDSDNDPTTGGKNAYRATAKLAGFDNVGPQQGSSGSTLPLRDSYYGGYFSGGNEDMGTRSYAYVGMKYDADGDGKGGTNYKIIGNGSVSTIINDNEGNPRIMFAPEAPEILFQDFGVGRLINGQARINIDPILKNSLYVDNKHPLKVLITLEGDCNGVYVTSKSIDGFTVKELKNGKSSVPFSWQIIANRADDIDATGKVSSKHVGLRLPIGPGPLETPKATIAETKDNKSFE